MTRTRTVTLDGGELRTWDGFHDAFAREFRFFGEYGRNLDAWVDCMSSLDESDFGLTDDELLVLQIRDYEDFADAAGEIAAALVSCSAAVNRRYEELDGRPRIALVPA
jgi:RNAse (barnase) inhibitor barstar